MVGKGLKQGTLQIRLHGRAGQGAKTTAQLYAEAALEKGYFIQAFPEYGPARQGAPMQAFVRISTKPIRLHTAVKNPDAVVVLDPSLLFNIQVTAGLKKGGILVANTVKDGEEIRKALAFKGKLFTLDATTIAMEYLGKAIPSTALLAAMTKAIDLIPVICVKSALKNTFMQKYGKEITVKNLKIFDKALKELKQW